MFAGKSNLPFKMNDGPRDHHKSHIYKPPQRTLYVGGGELCNSDVSAQVSVARRANQEYY